MHAADLHLDTPFKGISETAPAVGELLREASLHAFDNLVALCLERRAAFLLLAGDIYDGDERGLRAQVRFRDGLRRLADEGIETFVVHGNHDPVGSGWSAVKEWPEGVHFFGSDDVEALSVLRHGEVIATVQGISYGRREVRENLALRFSRLAGADCGVQIGLLHCNVLGAPDGHEPYSPCTVDELRGVGLDYWALGHVHTRTVLSGTPFGDEPFVVYPGNLQARSPRPSERGAKGATVVSVQGGRVVGLEDMPCDVVRYAASDVDISECTDVDAVHTALLDGCEDALVAAGGRSVLLQLRLVGRSAAHSELVRDSVLGELEESLRDEYDGTSPTLWVQSVADASRSLVDLASARASSDFVADLLATSEALEGLGARDVPLPIPASVPLGEEGIAELLGKMPADLRGRAAGMLDELAAGELTESATALALDHLDVA